MEISDECQLGPPDHFPVKVKPFLSVSDPLIILAGSFQLDSHPRPVANSPIQALADGATQRPSLRHARPVGHFSSC